MVTRVIQLVLAPVVMVSACAILLGSLQQRYAVINERLRAMSRELFDLHFSDQAAGEDEPRRSERLKEIDIQVPLLLRRHRLAHHAVLAAYGAAGVFILDMFAIAVTVLLNQNGLSAAVLVLFLAGLLFLLAGVALTAVEVWSSRRAVEYEVGRVMDLPKG